MIKDRIGNSLLFSVKPYIDELSWDKNYSGFSPLTIIWTKEAIEELGIESRCFIYNFLNDNISEFFMGNDVLHLVIDFKREKIRYYFNKSRKIYNFKIFSFEKLYSNILYIINKMNDIQKYKEINNKLETLLLENKIKTLSFREEVNGDTKIEIEWNDNIEENRKNEMEHIFSEIFIRMKNEMVIYDFQSMRIRVWDKSYVRNFIINKENYNTLFKNFIKEFCL